MFHYGCGGGMTQVELDRAAVQRRRDLDDLLVRLERVTRSSHAHYYDPAAYVARTLAAFIGDDTVTAAVRRLTGKERA